MTGKDIQDRLLGASDGPLAQAGEALRITLLGQGAAVLACALSPDGRRAVSADEAGILTWWDLETGVLLAGRKAHPAAATACAYSPDGRRLASASKDGTLKIWDAESTSLLSTPPGHPAPITACMFSPDGTRLLSCSEECVQVWDVVTGAELPPLVRNEKGMPFSRLGNPEAAGLVSHESSLNTIALSPDGRWAATSSCWVGTVKLRDPTTGAELRTFGGESDRREFTGEEVNACVFSPDGNQIAIAFRRTIGLWDCGTGVERFVIGKDGRLSMWPTACAFSPDGTRLAIGDSCERLFLRTAFDGALLATVQGPRGDVTREGITRCIFSPDGTRILSASRDGTLKIWDVAAILRG